MPLRLPPQMLLEALWHCSIHWWLDSHDPCLRGPLFPVESEVSTVASRAFIGSPKCREGRRGKYLAFLVSFVEVGLDFTNLVTTKYEKAF